MSHNIPPDSHAPTEKCSCGSRRRVCVLLIIGISVILAVWFFRAPLQNKITRSATLSNQSPPPELVEDMIEQSPDRNAAILAAWNTGKIVHRQAAMKQISQLASQNPSLPAELESIVLSGALDADMNVRETAFGILSSLKHSALPALAAAQ